MISRDLFDSVLFCYQEEWRNRKEMEEYLDSGSFRQLLGAMKVLGEIQDIGIIEAQHVHPLSPTSVGT